MKGLQITPMNNYPEESYGPEDGPDGCWIIDSYDEGPVFIDSDEMIS
jgi:hypothetical protein